LSRSWSDVNHQIEAFNTLQTVYVLKNTYNNFPKGSIHIVAVDSEVMQNENM